MQRERKKVLHIMNDFSVGGISIIVTDSFDKLNNEFDYHIMVLESLKVDVFNSFAQQNKDKIFFLLGFSSFFRLLTFLRVNKFDIIISSLWRSHFIAFFITLFMRKIKWVSFFHSTVFANIFDRYVHRLALLKSDVVVADSSATKKMIESTFNYKKRISVVAPVLRTEIFHRKPVSIKSSNQVSFVYVGRVAKIKNLTKVIEVIFGLSKRGINIRFDIYGPDKGDLKNVLNKAKSLGVLESINYKGILPHWQVFEVLPKYDFFIQLSDYEGMAMSVVEAMQVGVIPIVTPVGEIKNYAEHMDNAIVLERGEEEGFFRDIEHVINDKNLYASMTKSARSTFVSNFSYVKQLNSVLNSSCV